MKRIGNLFDSVEVYENLLASFYLARRGCRNSLEAQRFFFHLETELFQLQRDFENGSYQPGAYRFFSIRDPKPRIIAAAPFRDRVVHHAIVRVLTPIYERSFIYDSYATRKEKGTHAAIRRAQRFSRRRSWFLKADILKYFDSVNHEILMKTVRRKIKDGKLLDLIRKITAKTPVSGMGLPIGNLTSQFMANVYLDPFDHLVKDRMRIGEYLRYMDDFIIFADSRARLLEIKRIIGDFLSERLLLELHPGVTQINRCSHGLNFLGFRIFPNYIRVKPENRRRSMKKLRQRIKEWERGELEEEKMVQSITSITGHLRYFCPDMPLSMGVAAEATA